ncbi:hypothetical protein DITRI_Ditri08aG0113100 [Diplodiscus trichospermus]
MLRLGSAKNSKTRAGDEVTFVFTNQVDGKLVPIESKVNPRTEEREDGRKNIAKEKRFKLDDDDDDDDRSENLVIISYDENSKGYKLLTFTHAFKSLDRLLCLYSGEESEEERYNR